MITAYHRPTTIEEALELLSRKQPSTRPLAGGTALNQPAKESFEVVDLQQLGLDHVQSRGNSLEIGATVRLQDLLAVAEVQPVLRRCVQLEATYNLRQAATLAGSLVAADGRSPLTTAMLALDASLMLQPNEQTLALGEMLLNRPDILQRRLITRVDVATNARLAYHAVGRTPADWPLVAVAVAVWPAGRTRVALGGYGSAPIMALDGPEAGGLADAVVSAFASAGDQWASAEYRQDAARILAQRALAELESRTG